MVDISLLVVYIFLVVIDCALVFGVVYALALFSDLETDSINPIDMCRFVTFPFLSPSRLTR